MGGGLNLRGYAGYLAPETNQYNEYVEAYKGHSGAAINAELEIHEILPIIKNQPSFKTYIFGDAGLINTSTITKENYKEAFSDLRADAGIGFAVNLNGRRNFEMTKPLIFRVDIPFILTRYPDIDESYLQINKFVIGVGRAF